MLNPSPQSDSIWRWGFGRWLGHENRAFMNGTSILIKETPESSLGPSTKWGHSEKTVIYESESGPWPDIESAGNLILDRLPSLQKRKK